MPISGKRRVQLDFSPKELDDMEELMKNLSIKTKKGLIDHALELAFWHYETRKNGDKIMSGDPRGRNITIYHNHYTER